MDNQTIHVRIAVAVNIVGDWEASGSSAYMKHDQERAATAAIHELHSSTDDTSAAWLYWVEAEVPVPSKTTIRGRLVTDAERAAQAKEPTDGK
jgi:hypothetical protein